MSAPEFEFFKPEDFLGKYDDPQHKAIRERTARIANAKLLERGVRVKAYKGAAARPGGVWMPEEIADADSTHQALLIAIEPIRKDSLEDLARDIVNGRYHFEKEISIVERARKLLEGK